MARYNKIYAGPVEEVKPQVHEAICDAGALPGTGVIRTAGKFVQAGATPVGKVFIVQDCYLLGKGVDDAWPAGDRLLALDTLDEQIFNVRVPTGTSITQDQELTTNAAGKYIGAVSGKQVLMFASETYNNTSGSDQLVRARAARGYIKA